jgi:hypothetical protein
MKLRILASLICVLALSAVALAQDTNSPQQPGQETTQGRGQRGGRGGGWVETGNGGMMGRGVLGTVTEVAADHYTVKTTAGDLYTVHYSMNTRILKGGAQRRGRSENDPPASPPQAIKPTDIKVGDAIAANGEIDATAKSIGAVVIFQIDPERAKQMREMQANYGKTWLMGKVTAVNELKISLQGGPDNAIHTFAADENTTFRKRREPITLADVQVGDMVRVEGAVKDGTFIASAVAVMGPPPQGGIQPREGQPQAPPQ